jgi:hypothetical protein
MDHLHDIVSALDRFRGRPPPSRGLPFREWVHFCVVGPTLTLVVNLSLDEQGEGFSGRLVVLALERGSPGFHGKVESIPPGSVEAHPGFIDLKLGPSSLESRGGALHLQARTEDPAIAVDLTLRPRTMPLQSAPVALGSGALHWVVTPSMAVSGAARIGARAHQLDGASCYHDHNWGRFAWGDDFAWEWGYALPIDGATSSFVYSRVLDRRHHREHDRKLCVWSGAHLQRIFAGKQLQVEWHGLLRPAAIPRFPPLMALLAPGLAVDVPESISLAGAYGSDWIEAQVDFEEMAQLLVPDELGTGVSALSEVSARVSYRGLVCGESLGGEARGIFEFLHGA